MPDSPRTARSHRSGYCRNVSRRYRRVGRVGVGPGDRPRSVAGGEQVDQPGHVRHRRQRADPVGQPADDPGRQPARRQLIEFGPDLPGAQPVLGGAACQDTSSRPGGVISDRVGLRLRRALGLELLSRHLSLTPSESSHADRRPCRERFKAQSTKAPLNCPQAFLTLTS